MAIAVHESLLVTFDFEQGQEKKIPNLEKVLRECALSCGYEILSKRSQSATDKEMGIINLSLTPIPREQQVRINVLIEKIMRAH